MEKQSPCRTGGSGRASFQIEFFHLFGDLAGYKGIDPFRHWDPVNIDAAVTMGKLHNRLKDIVKTALQSEDQKRTLLKNWISMPSIFLRTCRLV